MAGFLFVANHSAGAIVGAAAGGIGLDEDRNLGLIAGVENALSEGVGEKPLVVVGNNESLLRRKASQEQAEEFLFGLGRQGIAALVVDANDLLVTGNDPGFDGGSAAGIGEEAGGVDAAVDEATAKFSSGFVVGDLAGGRLSATKDTEGLNGRTKGGQIGSDVAGASETACLIEEVDDRDGRFRGEARGGAQEIAIEHKVADDGEANLAETGEDTLESGGIGGANVLHRADCGSVGDDFRFLEEHHRNVIANGINTVADVAFEAGTVGKLTHRLLADDADQDIEQLLRNRHSTVSQRVKENCIREGQARPTGRHCLVESVRMEGRCGGSGRERRKISGGQANRSSEGSVMKYLATVLLGSIALLQAPSGQAQTAEQLQARELAREMDEKHDELVSIEKDMARAIQWNNGTIFRRIYGDDFEAILPSGQLMDKTRWIATVENSGIKYSSFVATDIKVRIFQDTAVVTCLWSSRGMEGSRQFSRQWRVTHVYIYGQRGWKAVASQETLLPG